MNFQDDKFDELSKLLKEALDVYKADRALAIKNYEAMQEQLKNVLDQDFEMSQDGILENGVNEALKLVLAASAKLDRVIAQVSGIIKTQMKNESREKIAQSFLEGGSGGAFIPNKPVSFKDIQQRKQQKLDFDESED